MSSVELPCARCGAPVAADPRTTDLVGMLNRALRGGGQPPLGPDQVVACPACRPVLAAEQEQERARQEYREDVLMRRLRAGEIGPEDLPDDMRHRRYDEIRRVLEGRRKAAP